MKYNGIIYRWYNNISKKSYIGQTRTEKKRERNFRNIRKEYTQWGSKIDNARKKYGVDKDIWEKSIEFKYSTDDLEELCNILNEKEIYYISQYDSYNNGYNSTLGGDGSLLTEVMRKELSERGKEQWSNLSNEEKEEWKKRSISLWNNLTDEEKGVYRENGIKGMKILKEDKERFYKWLESNHTINSYKLNRLSHIGKKRDKSTKDKIRESVLKNDNGRKKIRCLDIDGNIKQTFNSISEVEKYGYKEKGVSKVLHGQQKTHRGLLWEFVDKNDYDKKKYTHAVYIPRLNRYRSRITINGKQYTLGHYEKPEDANKIYLLALDAKQNGKFEDWYNNIEECKLQFK